MQVDVSSQSNSKHHCGWEGGRGNTLKKIRSLTAALFGDAVEASARLTLLCTIRHRNREALAAPLFFESGCGSESGWN